MANSRRILDEADAEMLRNRGNALLMRADGMSISDIAKALGVSPSTVSKWMPHNDKVYSDKLLNEDLHLLRDSINPADNTNDWINLLRVGVNLQNNRIKVKNHRDRMKLEREKLNLMASGDLEPPDTNGAI